jgi:hypothetical protein
MGGIAPALRGGAMSIVFLLCSCESPPERDALGGIRGNEQPDAGGSASAGDSSAGAGGERGGAGDAIGGAGTGPGDAAGASGSGDPAADGGGTTDSDVDGGAAGIDAPAPSCLDDITNYTEPGPFEFSNVRSGPVNIWVPDVPAGCKLPVVHFANGTGGTCATYQPILEHLASHGFLTACYESPQADDGAHCIAALQTVFSDHSDLADMKIGSSGQETGGATALDCVSLAEDEWGDTATYAGHAIAPASGSGANASWREQYARIDSPVFVFNGSDDVLVSESWVRMGYDALDTEKYWYEATGALHIPVPVSWASESVVVFFRWKLLGDETAGEYFGDMPDGDRWNLQAQDPGP